jgi:hypothetical protein
VAKIDPFSFGHHLVGEPGAFEENELEGAIFSDEQLGHKIPQPWAAA